MGKVFAPGKVRLCVVAFAAAFLVSLPASAQDLGNGQVQILGNALDVSPETQAAPVGIPTVVHTVLPVHAGLSLPEGLTVRGELTGPGISGSISLVTFPNGDFTIPGQSVKGGYALSDIRLLAADQTVIGYAAHRTATITVTDVLVTQVTSRPLTYQEMIDKGIVVSQSDFSAYSFTFAMTLDSKTVTFDVPIVFLPSGPPVLPTIPTQSGTPPGAEFFRPPQIRIVDLAGPTGLPNTDNQDDTVPPVHVPTLLLIPGDVAFLNQFFSVSVMVQNGAPAGSNLVLQNVTATPRFPGELQVKSANPPVNLGDPVPIQDPGPDGMLGTADDVTFLVGQAKGNADFVVEGLRSGTFEVPIDVNATVAGLPAGPLPLSARTSGTVLVRHPSFFVALDHPDTIREGEGYTITATVTNTSTTVANQVSLSLDKASLSGAELESDAAVALGNIAPNDNAIATFQMKALRTGRVEATAVFSDGSLSGAITLTTGIGELGVPISPDTLILPKEISAFDSALVTPARQLVGLAWSLAKSPAGTTDPTLPTIGEQAVRWRVSDLALAARHQRIGEGSDVAFAEWMLGWLNSDPSSVSVNFDLLRRLSSKGTALEAAAGAKLSTILSTAPPADFEEELSRILPEKRHIAAVLSRDADPSSAVARLALLDPVSGTESAFTAGDEAYVRGLPNAAILPVSTASGGLDYAWIGEPSDIALRIRVIGERKGTFDLFVSAPTVDGGAVRLTFSNVSVSPGQLYDLDLAPGRDPAAALLLAPGAAPVAPEVESLAPAGLEIVAASQDLDANPLGKAVSVLFNRSLDPASPVTRSATNYRVSSTIDDPVDVVAPQAADPRLVVVGVRNHPSPYREWTIELRSLKDQAGTSLDPDPQSGAVTITDTSPGGTVTGQVIGADGKPVPDAEIVLREDETSDITGQVFLSDFAVADADANGQFTFDYVPLRQGQVFELEAADPATGYQGTAFGQIQQENETVHINVVLLGRGDIVGTVRDTGGNPLAGAYITAASVFFPGEQGQASTNSAADGTFEFRSLPVGPVQLWAFYQGAAAVKTAYQSAYIPAPGAKAQQDIVVDIQPSATVSGTVTHENDGSPAVGLYVVMYGEPVAVPWYPYSQRKYFGFVVTDESGSFAFPTVSPGNDEIQVYDPARGWAIVIDRTISVAPDQQLNLPLVELDPQAHAGAVEGHVYVNRNGAVSPDPNALVWLSNSGLQVSTDAAGAYMLTGVPVGNQTFQTYDQTLHVGTSRTTAIQEGVTATLDFAIAIDTQTAGLVGSVVDPLGNPVAGAAVAWFDSTGAVARGVVADASGQFSFDAVTPGSYRLFAFGSDLSAGTSQPDVGFVDVTVSAGHVSTVVIPFVGYGKVQGNVTSSHFDDQGQRVDSPVQAHLTLTTGRIVTQGNFGRIAWPGDPVYPGAAETDSDPASGAYSFDLVLAGQFGVSVHSPILGDQSASGAVGHAGQVVTQDFRFQGASSIDGFLYDEKGTPVSGASIDLFGGTTGTLPGGAPLATVATTADGTDPHGPGYFRFAAVPAGDKTISFHGTADGRERFAVAYASVPNNPAAIRVALHAGRVQDVRVTILEPVSGVLQPVSGASVLVFESDWPRRSFRTTTAADGTATFPGISEGLYAVRAQSLIHTGSTGGCVCDEGGVSQATIALTGSGSVHGTVLFPGALTPVANAQILVYAGGLIGASETDDAGSYRVDGLPLGTALSVQVRDNSSARFGFSPSFVLASDGDDHEADVTLIALGFVDGTFFDATATTPIPGATVTLFSSSALGNYTLKSGTDGSGAFEFGGIPQGTFTLNASAGVLTASGAGSISSEGQVATVALRAEAVGSIAVHVVDAAGAELPALSPPPIVTISGHGDTRTAAATTVQFDTIPVGVTYSVSAEEQSSPPHHRAIGNVAVSAEGAVAPITLQYVPYGRVAVHVVRADPDGSTTPITSGQVRLASTGLYSYQFPFGSSVSVDSGGNAEFVDVGGGPLTARYSDPATGVSGSAAGAITADGQQVDLTISIGSTATVQGRVFQPAPNSSTPAAGATVVIAGSNSPTRAVATDADGMFHFDGVPYGNYQLTVDGGSIAGKLRTSFGLTVGVLVGNALDVGALVLDGLAPTVVSSSPASGAIGLARRPTITLTFSEAVDALRDPYANSATSSISGKVSLAGDRLSGTWTPYVDLKPGEDYVLSVPAGSLEDANGWPIAPFSMSFSTLDNVGPAVIATSPSAGAKFVGPQTTVTIAFDQAIDPASVVAGSVTLSEIYPSPGPIGSSIAVSSASTVLLTPSVSALDTAGLYQVTISGVRDAAGNPMSQPYSFQFWTTDNTPPAVSFQGAPASVLALHTYGFTVAFRSADGSIVSGDVASLVVKANEVLVASFSESVGDSSRSFSYRVDKSLAGSTLRLRAIATDFSGNQSEADLDLPVGLDQPPAGSISLSTAGPAVPGQSVTATANVTDDLGLQFAIVRVTGLTAGSCSLPVSGQTQASGTCTIAIPVTAGVGGSVGFSLDLSDSFQEVVTGATSISVARDAVPPALGAITPGEGTLISSGANVTVTASATDDVAVSKVVFAEGGASSTDTASPYSWTFKAPVVSGPTDLPVTVAAYDYGGNSASRTVTLHVSPDQPPAGQIALSPTGPILPGRVLTATVSATDDFGLGKITATGTGAVTGTQTANVAGTNASSSFSFTVPLGAAAGAPISVAADLTDSVGQVTHLSAASTTVAADVTPPVIVSTSPIDGSTYVSGDRVSLSAQVTDDVAVKSVDFVVDGATTTAAASPYSISYTAKAVTAATTVSVRVIARDLAGNTSESDFSLQITPLNNVGAPTVSFVCPTTGAMFPAGYSAPISVSASDDQAVARVDFFQGDSSTPFASVTTGTAGVYGTSYAIPADAADGSSITLRARAYDFANNIGETTTIFTVVAGDVFSSNATITNGSTNHDGHTIIVTGGTLTVIGHHAFNGMVVLNGATVTQTPTTLAATNPLDVDLGTRGLYVACGGAVDVTAKGYAGGVNSSPGQSYPGVATSGVWAGGSYGGQGSDNTANHTVSGGSYGSVLDPAEAGAGGGSGSGFYAGNRGGNGGGVVRIAGSQILIDGRVAANGENGNTSGGAGGAIRLDSVRLAGSGNISAQGGNSAPGIVNGQMGAPGGGGRIAIYADASAFGASRVVARGGIPSAAFSSGGPGTVYLFSPGSTWGDLVVDNGTATSSAATPVQPPLTSGTIVSVSGSTAVVSSAPGPGTLVGVIVEISRNGAATGSYVVKGASANGLTLTLDENVEGSVQAGDTYRGVYRFDTVVVKGNLPFNDGLGGSSADLGGTVRTSSAVFSGGTIIARGGLNFDNLTLANKAVLTHDGGAAAIVDINVSGRLTIDSTSRIDVTAKGYAGGVNSSAGKSYPGVSASGTWSGGSHGGRGGQNNPGGATPSGQDFGSVFDPEESGAGGGSGTGFYSGGRGGNGGGAVVISAGLVHLDGKILADGEPGNASGGAGGSIQIHASTVEGVGIIESLGGASAPGILPNQIKGEAGGGGRIAVFADLTGFDRTRIVSRGGAPTTGRNSGGAGTLLLKSSSGEFGDLVVDNGTASSSEQTQLVAAGSGTVASVSPGAAGIAITDIDTSKVFSYGVVGEYLQISRAGSLVGSSRIVGYGPSANSVILENGSAIQPGDTYQGVYEFDSVGISGKSFLRSLDPIVTGSLDVGSGSAIEDPTRNLPPAGFFNPVPAASIAAGKTLSVTVLGTDDFAVASIRLTASGSVSFDQTKGTSGKSASASFSISIPANAAGVLTLTAVVSDDLGVVTALTPVSVSVYQDLPPTVVLSLDPPDQTIALRTVTATAVMTDDYGLSSVTFHVSGATSLTQTFTMSGTSSVESTSFTIPLSASTGGTVSAFATVVDGYGHSVNSPSVTLPVVPDTTPPSVNIGQPADGTEIPGGNTFTVSGSASDNVQVKTLSVSFNGQNVSLNPLSSFSKSFTAPNVTGRTNYPVVVAATDYAGNTAQATVTVVVRPPNPPQVTITCPSGSPDGVAGFPVSFNFTVNADKGFTRFEAYVGGSTTPATTSYTSVGNAYSASVPMPSSAPSGDANVELRAYDSLGMTGSAFATVDIVSGDIIATNTLIGSGDTSHDGNVVIVSHGTLTLDGHHAFEGLIVLDGASVTQIASTATKTGAVDVSLGSTGLFVACNGAMDVSNLGYPAQTTYPGIFSKFQFAPHGGLGYEGTMTALDAFGSTMAPAEPGAGGYGPGGGIIDIEAPTGWIDGHLRADGQSVAGGTGAGGSVWLDIGELHGIGSISAAGGSNLFGGSGGGRVALYGDLSGFPVANATAGSTIAPGTVFWKGPADQYGNVKAFGGNSGKQTVLVAAGSGTVGSAFADTTGVTISDSATRKFPYGVVGEFLQVSRNGALVGEWQILAQSADGLSLTLDPAAQVETGDGYQGVYRFDSVLVSQAKLFCADPVLAANLSLTNGGRLADPTHDHPPSITVTSSPVGRVTPGKSLSVTIGASDDHFVSLVSLTGSGAVTFSQSTSLFFSPQTWSIPVPSTTPVGSVIHLVATAADDVGFSSSVSMDVVVEPDTFPPTIQFTSPAGGTSVMAGTPISIAATINDDTAVASASIVVDGNSGNCYSNGGDTWRCTYYAIADPVSTPRPIVATVSAVDPDGNPATATLDLTIVPSDDQTAPTIAFDCPAALSPVAPEMDLDLHAASSDDRAVYRVDYFLNDDSTPFASETDSQWTTLHVPATAQPGDVLTVRAVVYDFALNSASATLQLAVVDGDVVSSDSTIGASDLGHEGRLVLVSGATLTLDGHHDFKGLAIYGGTVTQVDPSALHVGAIDLGIGDTGLYLSCDSSIDVGARGYLGGYSADNFSLSGRAPDGVPGSSASAGGSHGGVGGVDSRYPATPGEIAGSLFAPSENGAGGGGYLDPDSATTESGGNGGGRISLSSAGPVVFDGQVIAWGGDVQNNFGLTGAGAGGTVAVHARTIAGDGTVDASGGFAFSNGAPGGGGRVLLIADQVTIPVSSIYAVGGGGPVPAGAGTILIKSGAESFGDLTIDNGGGPGSTPIESMGMGTISQTGSTTLDGVAYPTFTDSLRLFPDDLAGHFVIFNDDAVNEYSVLSNDSHTIVLFPDPALPLFSGLPGTPYQGVLRLDSLAVKGGAAVSTTDVLDVTGDAITVDTSSGSSLNAKNFP